MRPFLVVLGIIFLGGCAAPQLFSYIIYEDPTSFVRLDSSPSAQVDQPETLFSHPVSVTKDQLTRIFEGLLVQEHRSSVVLWFMDEAEVTPAFTAKEVAFLVEHIGSALRQAVSEEVIKFYMSTPLNSTNREITSGSVFVKEQQFHVMLSNYRMMYSIPPYGIVYDRRHPTYSIAPRTVDLLFHPQDYTIPNVVSFFERVLGETHDGEVIIDLSHFSAVRL